MDGLFERADIVIFVYLTYLIFRFSIIQNF